MTEGSADETRKHERYGVVLKVDFESVEGLAEYTENLSEEGVFIATEQILEKGTPIEFQLSFPGLVQPISLAGTVIWRRARESLNDDVTPGIGVRINFSSDVDRNWLLELLKKMAPPGPAQAQEAAQESHTPREYVVLLAEDNPMTRTLFTEALQTLAVPAHVRLAIIEANDLNEAKQKFARQATDLLIIEWRLCRNQTREQLDQLLQQAGPGQARTTLVVVGATAQEQHQALACGADVFLRRPVPARALLQTVQALLSQAN